MQISFIFLLSVESIALFYMCYLMNPHKLCRQWKLTFVFQLPMCHFLQLFYISYLI